MEKEDPMCVEEIPYLTERIKKIAKKVKETGEWKGLPEKYVEDLNRHRFILDKLPPKEDRTQEVVEMWINKYISAWDI
jgi:hypothetical protein